MGFLEVSVALALFAVGAALLLGWPGGPANRVDAASEDEWFEDPARTVEPATNAPEAPPKRARASRKDAQGESGACRKVLVVEDEPQVRRFVCSSFRGLGYHVVEAADGLAGLDAVRRDATIDLLFTDLVLPRGLSGLELARLAMANRPGLKVLLTSGYSGAAFSHYGNADEPLPLLQKPYDSKELEEAVEALFAEPEVKAA